MRPFHPTARTCIRWAVILFLLGALAVVFVPRLYGVVSDALGPHGVIGTQVIGVLLTLLQMTAMPLGAALVGAAIVIDTLSVDRDREGTERQESRTDAAWSGAENKY